MVFLSMAVRCQKDLPGKDCDSNLKTQSVVNRKRTSFQIFSSKIVIAVYWHTGSSTSEDCLNQRLLPFQGVSTFDNHENHGLSENFQINTHKLFVCFCRFADLLKVHAWTPDWDRLLGQAEALAQVLFPGILNSAFPLAITRMCS